MSVSMQAIKELREKTGAGMMDVKKALMDAEGNQDKAIEILRQKGAATAEKKASRAAAEGKVASVSADGVVALVEVNCETDFSANNEKFATLVDVSRKAVIESDVQDVDALMTVSVNGTPIQETFNDIIGAVRENMKVARFVRYTETANSHVQDYIHAGGKIGVLIEVSSEKPEGKSNAALVQFAKDVAMQIAAFSPEYVSRSEIPQEEIDNETRIEMGKEDIQKKPENIRGKIVEGRVEKNFASRVLLSQAFVKDSGKTVGDLVDELSKQLGGAVKIERFTRFGLGELSPAPEEEALTV